MDTIADLLTRIRNAGLARKKTVAAPWSRVSEAICQILTEQGYLSQFSTVKSKLPGGATVKSISLTLAYTEDNLPVITEIHRASKPGRRQYLKVRRLPKILKSYGSAIISTPQGLMTDQQARQKNLGGEIICTVW